MAVAAVVCVTSCCPARRAAKGRLRKKIGKTWRSNGESYLHLRKPSKLADLAISERATLTKSTHFLDSLTLDQPKGSWSLKHDAGNKMVSAVQCL